jgi:5-deoxy-glucuronate isomerase
VTRRLLWPAGSAAREAYAVQVTPDSAGWSFAGLRVLSLEPEGGAAFATGPDEMLVLPLQGGCVVECDGRSFPLEGRADVWSRVSDFAYLPRDAQARIVSRAGGCFALPTARARVRREPAYGAAETVPVEVRGRGAASRQVTNFCAPGAFATDRLTAVEVLTPAGNWSSYPPHKHDEARPGEAVLEEIYYFRIRGRDGFGLHRTYTQDGAIDETVTVRDGDVFLVPRGYHGPCVAAPDHDMYYLNVLAGPGAERSLAFRDDPRHAWVRDAWNGRPPDPRLPMATARGPQR